MGRNISSIEGKQVISGIVIHGRKQGRELGFPTANIDSDSAFLPNGVYGVHVSLKECFYWGIMNIGVKPTYGSALKKTIEVHLLNFSDEIYGEFVECQLLFKVREEKKFASIERLKQQIKEDIDYANSNFKLFEDSFKTKKNEFVRKEQIS